MTDSAGPNGQPGPHDSETKQSTAAWDGAEPAKLTGGYVFGEANDTGVFLATIRTYLYPFPNRYHALAMMASAMADGGEVAVALTTTQTLMEAGVFDFPRRAKPSAAA